MYLYTKFDEVSWRLNNELYLGEGVAGNEDVHVLRSYNSICLEF